MRRAGPPTARLAGLAYLAVIALGLFGEAGVRAALLVPGDAAATASRLLAHPSLWRVGIATDLLMHLLDVPLIVYFYLLLRPAGRGLALLATAFNLVQTCVLALNKLTLVAALSLTQASASAAAPAAAGLQTLALLAADLHGHGFAIGLLFFGMACLVRAQLVWRSGVVPRPLGVGLLLAGGGYLANSLALLVWPPLAAALFPAVLVPALVAELALSAWLVWVNPPLASTPSAATVRA